MSYVVELKEIPGTDDVALELPDEIVSHLNLRVGDTLNWEVQDDGAIVLSKAKETELVLVETVQQFRVRYVVRVPKGCEDWALDTVTMEEANELSQMYLGESILSSRVIDTAELQRLYIEDNPELEDVDVSQVFKPTSV